MTIYRKILKVKTVGSRKEGNLRPEFADDMPNIMAGVSFVVHEYNEVKGWCICECWVSDHPTRNVPRTMTDLNELAKHECVLKVLTKHPLSPKIIGRLSITKDPSLDASPKTFSLTKKTVIRDGKELSFKYTKKDKTTGGRDIEKIILDEG